MSSSPNVINREDQPLVTVVIPAYNSADYISEALDSVIAQDYPAIEIIVIDDGSTDNTREVVSAYGDRVRLIAQENQGSAVARNKGIQQAQGKYIAFLDADDVWWCHKIFFQIEALTANGHKMAYSRFIWWYMDVNGKFINPEAEFAKTPNPNIFTDRIVTGSPYAELLLDCIVWTSTVIVEKAELENVGMFDEQLRKGQDYDLWLKLSRRIDMLGLEQATALYRIHPTSITSSIKDINYEYLILSRAVKQWGEKGPDGRSPPAGLVQARLARSSFAHGHAHLIGGNPRIAEKSFLLSMRHSGLRIKTLALWVVAIFKKYRYGLQIGVLKKIQKHPTKT